MVIMLMAIIRWRSDLSSNQTTIDRIQARGHQIAPRARWVAPHRRLGSPGADTKLTFSPKRETLQGD